tara:strand:- start:476 stop:742 length:267 start_codon:yes stop_codon:yes gene_type:complete
MSKVNEITYCTTECLEQTINILKEISKDYEWENETEYIRTIYMLSTLGYVLSNNEYKDEMIMFFKLIGRKLKENNQIIKEAKFYANIT